MNEIIIISIENENVFINFIPYRCKHKKTINLLLSVRKKECNIIINSKNYSFKYKRNKYYVYYANIPNLFTPNRKMKKMLKLFIK